MNQPHDTSIPALTDALTSVACWLRHKYPAHGMWSLTAQRNGGQRDPDIAHLIVGTNNHEIEPEMHRDARLAMTALGWRLAPELGHSVERVARDLGGDLSRHEALARIRWVERAWEALPATIAATPEVAALRPLLPADWSDQQVGYWWLMLNEWLDGERPIDVLRQGRDADAREAASHAGEVVIG